MQYNIFSRSVAFLCSFSLFVCLFCTVVVVVVGVVVVVAVVVKLMFRGSAMFEGQCGHFTKYTSTLV